MAIEKITTNTLTASKPAGNHSPQKKPDAAATPGNDSVNITEVAQNLKNAMTLSSSQSFINVERIEKIQQAIKDGAYSINAEQIADKLIRMEKELP